VSRARVMARTRKEDRDRLMGKTPAELAANVVGLGEAMARDAARFETGQDAVRTDATNIANGWTDKGLQKLRESEAHHLAHARADLVAICDEMRKRIDHLLSGKDIGSGR